MQRELLGIKAGMGYVAAASTRDPDLGKELGAFLKEDHLRLRVALGACDCREKTRRSTAHDRYRTPFFHMKFFFVAVDIGRGYVLRPF
jgi:hypothetical protein